MSKRDLRLYIEDILESIEAIESYIIDIHSFDDFANDRKTQFKGKLIFDTSKPDGTPRKLLDVSKINHLDWTAATTLRDGITKTYDAFQKTMLLKKAELNKR